MNAIHIKNKFQIVEIKGKEFLEILKTKMKQLETDEQQKAIEALEALFKSGYWSDTKDFDQDSYVAGLAEK